MALSILLLYIKYEILLLVVAKLEAQWAEPVRSHFILL
jgi:hypothetical protein